MEWSKGIQEKRNEPSGEQDSAGKDGRNANERSPFQDAANRFGDLRGFLLAKKLVSAQRLAQAVDISLSQGTLGFIGQVLSEWGDLPEERFVSILAKECGIPHINLRDYFINREAMAQLPFELCREHMILPMDRMGRNLTVAIVDPFDGEGLYRVREQCPALRIRPMLCSYSDFVAVFNSLYKNHVWREDRFPMYRSLDPDELSSALLQGAKIVDVRAPVHFGASFIPGSLNIGLALSAAQWLRMVLRSGDEYIIVGDNRERVREAIEHFLEAGYRRIAGYVENGVLEWAESGRPLDHLPQLTVQSLDRVLEKYRDHVLIDVRLESEWQYGHLPGAFHRPLQELLRDGLELSVNRHVSLICSSGYRSNIAGSFLKARGYSHVYSIVGGMTAWENYVNIGKSAGGMLAG